MAIKVLITEIGQHLIADVGQVTNKETEELIAYWVKNARVVSYRPVEGAQEAVSINFMDPCPLTAETEYAIAHQHIVSIVEPRPEVVESYLAAVNPIDETPAGPQTETVQHEAAPETPDETGLLPKPERPEA